MNLDPGRKLATALFGEGWLFFVPYLLAYVATWILFWPVWLTRDIFWGLHGGGLILLALYLRSLRQRLSKEDWIFWGGLFLLFLLPGAYLEFPSDPWEHFRRIFSWESVPVIGDSPIRIKFAYFWGWTLLDWVPLVYRRLALAFYSAFWQWLVAFQYARLMTKFGFSRRWVFLQVLGFVFLFGTNLFSFRYYALSSTPLAFIAYFQALGEVLDWTRTGLFRFWSIPLLLILIYFNHQQELGLFLISATVIIAENAYRKLDDLKRRRVHFGLLGFAVVGMASGFLLQVAFPWIYDRLGAWRAFYYYGGFRIISPHSPHLEALGACGMISLLMAVGFFPAQRLIALLTLAPFLALLFPPTAFLLALRIKDYNDSYRLLYAIPMSLMLITGLREIVKKRLRGEGAQQAVVLAAVILVALPFVFPWRGKLFFQVYVPPAERTLRALDQTAEWFRLNRHYPLDCWIVSDGATGFALSTQLARPVAGDRARLTLYGRTLYNAERIDLFLKANRVCGFLVGIRKDIPPAPASPIAARSGHWSEELGDLNYLVSPEFELATVDLIHRGWNQTWVPPFYTLYEPPEDGLSK